MTPHRTLNVSAWLGPRDFGASGSETTAIGVISSGSNELLLENSGDFVSGNEITADGCFAHTYGMLYNDQEPYFAANQQPLTDELEIRGVNHIRKHRVFILHITAPGVFSWMVVDREYQTHFVTKPIKSFYWEWQQEGVTISDKWIQLADGIEIRFKRSDWKPGESAMFHATKCRRATIVEVKDNTLVLNRKAEVDCECVTVRHHDQAAMQKCIDSAIIEGKGVRIPPGRFNLSGGLRICEASICVVGAGREGLPVFATFEVTERTIDKNRQDLPIPDIEVNTFWTNLPDEAQTVIELYHAHGTNEQYHSEMKSDLCFERMPSGKFATNALLLQLAMLAFNVLRILGQSALKMKEALPRNFKVQRRRLRSVLQDLIYIACKRTSHSNSIFLKFGRYCPWFEVFRQLHTKFC